MVAAPEVFWGIGVGRGSQDHQLLKENYAAGEQGVL